MELRLEKRVGIVFNGLEEDDIILLKKRMLLNNFSKSILVSPARRHVCLEDAIICNTVVNSSINVSRFTTCL